MWCCPLLTATWLAAASFAPADTVAIVNVSVLPMTREVVLPSYSVVVANGRIIEMGPATSIRIPRTATRIDGRGKFLLPGLADMHVHLTTSAELPMYVGSGVLTVRDLNGSPETLRWRAATRDGSMLGPRIFSSGPMLSGKEIPWRNKVTPATAAEATAAVEAQKAAGYDQIKLYDGLSREAFTAAVAAAKAAGMPSSSHIPKDVGFEGVLSSGITGLEHLDKTVSAAVGHELDTLRIPAIVAQIRKAGVWVTPTLASMIELALVGTGRYDSLMARPEARAAPADLREFWTTITGRMKGSRTPVPGVRYNPWTEYQLRLAGALARAGVPMLAGTDLPNAVLVPGSSLHEELAAMMEAGLTPYQALVAATSAPARFFGQEGEWGTVARGQRATLILVDGNPLADLRIMRYPAGAMLGSRWLGREELARLRGETTAAPPAR